MSLVVGGLFGVGFALAYVMDASSQGQWLTRLGVMFVLFCGVVAVRTPSRFPSVVAAYLPFSRVYPFLFAGGGFNMTNALLGLGLLAWIVARWKGKPPRRVRLLGVLLALFMLAGAVGVTTAGMRTAVSLPDQLQLFKRWAEPFLLYFVVYAVIETREDVSAALLAMLWTSALVAGTTWWDLLASGNRHSIEASRIGGVLGQPNDMGAFLVYYGIPFLALALRTRGYPGRLVFGAAYLLAARSMLTTFSRGAYLAMGVGSGMVLAIGSPFLFLGSAAAGIAVYERAPQLLPESVTARLSQTGIDEGLAYEGRLDSIDASSRDRLILWSAAREMMLDYPVLGVGLGRFQEAVEDYLPDELQKEGSPRDAHNAYLLMGAELGIPGLALLVALIVTMGVMALRLFITRPDSLDRAFGLAFLGTVSAVAVSCALGSRFFDMCLVGYLWMLAGLLSALSAMKPTAAREAATAAAG